MNPIDVIRIMGYEWPYPTEPIEAMPYYRRTRGDVVTIFFRVGDRRCSLDVPGTMAHVFPPGQAFMFKFNSFADVDPRGDGPG